MDGIFSIPVEKAMVYVEAWGRGVGGAKASINASTSIFRGNLCGFPMGPTT